MSTPATLVLGHAGAGKTTLISRWLAERAPGESVAVLLSELGSTALRHDPALIVALQHADQIVVNGADRPTGVELVSLRGWLRRHSNAPLIC